MSEGKSMNKSSKKEIDDEEAVGAEALIGFLN